VKLRQQGFLSRIHTRAARSHPLSDGKIDANRRRSQVRVRIEHEFGAQETAPGGRLVRVIGLVRAKAKFGLQNLAYNIR
jgi:transposase, IS5 family